MLVSQGYNNGPINFFGETLSDGIKLGILIERLKKRGISFTYKMEEYDIKGISIDPEELIRLLEG